jgi:sodium transport system permease protein
VSAALVLGEVATVYAKEMRSLARDRHTVIYSLFLPLFLYPAVLFGTLQVAAFIKGVEERRTLRIGVMESVPGDDELLVALRRRPGIAVVPLPAAVGLDAEGQPPVEAVERWLARGRADAVLTFRNLGGGPPPEGRLEARISFSGARGGSRDAKTRLEAALEDFRRDLLLHAARGVGEDAEFIDLLSVKEENLSTTQEVTNYLAGLILPLLMVVMIALGALYPALDCTVGERERKSLETTLLSPVRRESLVAGKYAAVVSFSLLAFLFNFGSMGLTLAHLRLQFELSTLRLSLTAIVVILAAAVLMALFLGGIMMLLAFQARSFKEGQTYVMPVYLGAALSALVTASPETALTPAFAWVPVVNLILLLRGALQGELSPWLVGSALASSTVYTLLSLLGAATFLRRQTIMSGGEVALREADLRAEAGGAGPRMPGGDGAGAGGGRHG